MRRNPKSHESVLIRDLDTSIIESTMSSKPLEDMFMLIPDEANLPDTDLLFASVKEINPGACALDSW